MERIHPLTREEAPEAAKPAYDANMAVFGQILNTTGIFAYRPSIQAGVKALGGGIAESGLVSEKLRCLINVRIASQVGCGY